MMKVLGLALSLITLPAAAGLSEIAKAPRKIRVEHARELMGKFYEKSVVKKGEDRKRLEKNILKTVEERLPKGYKALARSVTQTIINEANKHEFDPYFV